MELDASQSAAVAELDERLSDEAEVLSTAQQKVMRQLETNNKNECDELEQKIEMRRTLLDQKVNTSLSAHLVDDLIRITVEIQRIVPCTEYCTELLP